MSHLGQRKPTRPIGATTLQGFEEGGNDEFHLSVHTKTREGIPYRPHLPFQNWRSRYQIPWIAFMEIAMMVIYLIIGIVHQQTSIDFTLDIAQAIDDYFLDGFDFDDPPDNSHIRTGNIYFYDKLLEIAQKTGDRFHSFATGFPCTKRFTSDLNYHVKIYTISGDSVETEFNSDNTTLLTPFITPFLTEFAQIVMTMDYQIQSDIPFEIRVTAEFTLLDNADVVVLDMFHTRSPKIQERRSNLAIVFPILNALMAVFSILLNIHNLYAIYKFSSEKSEQDFQSTFAVFARKVDKWTYYSLVTHFATLIACIQYSLNGQELNTNITSSMVLLAISSSMHCILLVRYLKQIPSTTIVVNVIFNAGFTLIQFIVGCLVLFIGYLILGNALFGTSTVNFATFLQGACVLVAVIQGDSIQDIFDTVTVRSDRPRLYGFLYNAVWVFFSLTILYNIAIAIFERSLTREIYSAQTKKEEKSQDGDRGTLDIALPIQIETDF